MKIRTDPRESRSGSPRLSRRPNAGRRPRRAFRYRPKRPRPRARRPGIAEFCEPKIRAFYSKARRDDLVRVLKKSFRRERDGHVAVVSATTLYIRVGFSHIEPASMQESGFQRRVDAFDC